MAKLLSSLSAALFLAPQIIAIAVIGASSLLGLSECGGASNPPATSTPNTTPAGNYTVPVTATSSGAAMSLNLQVTVQ
jgi:hypothetical protein